MKNRPTKFNYDLIQRVVTNEVTDRHGLFLNPEFAVVNGSSAGELFRHFLSKNEPLLIDDYRMGLVLEGDVYSNINLIDRHITAGSLLFLSPGSIVQPLAVNGKLEIMGLAVFGDMPFMQGRAPSILNGGVRDFVIRVDEPEIAWLRQFIELIWKLVHSPSWSRDVMMGLVASMVWFYDECYRSSSGSVVNVSHSADVFARFIALVNEHCRREHRLSFYADRLCLTQRHLGVVVKSVSGNTAKEWIDRAIITEAKVLLKHTDKTVAQISDALNFPNPGFFTKYFKRLAGVTPRDYRTG